MRRAPYLHIVCTRFIVKSVKGYPRIKIDKKKEKLFSITNLIHKKMDPSIKRRR